MIFFHFLSSLQPISAPVPFKTPIPSQINLMKMQNKIFYYYYEHIDKKILQYIVMYNSSTVS